MPSEKGTSIDTWAAQGGKKMRSERGTKLYGLGMVVMSASFRLLREAQETAGIGSQFFEIVYGLQCIGDQVTHPPAALSQI